MADVLLFGDTVRSAELRHEVPLLIPDPFLYAERDGVRHVVGSSFEGPRLAAVGGYAFHPFEEFGLDELRRTEITSGELTDELVVRAVRALGITHGLVPASFPLLTGDRLRAGGVVLTPDQASFDERRRVKTEAELAGIRRAQRAAEEGMAAARDLLRRASVRRGGLLELAGAPLTSERVKEAVSRAFGANGASAEDFIVSHGAQAAIAHDLGAGELRAGETIIIDIWPRDNASSCHSDMTRTFLVGEVPDEVARWHRLCLQALERALRDARPGVSGVALFDGTCEIFEAAGYPTQRTKADGETLGRGFHHSLGHGVGLSVHEEPILGRLGRAPLLRGEVLAIEPGLYEPGFGGLRLEDIVLVRDQGASKLTDFPYELTP